MSTTVHDVVTRYSNQGVSEVMQDNIQMVARLRQLNNEIGKSGGMTAKQKEELTGLSDQMRENNKMTYAMRRGYMLMRTEVRNENMVLIESARAMQSVANVGKTMMNMWQAYTVGMIRIENAQRGYNETTKDMVYWQGLANRYLQEFGADSTYYKEAAQNAQNLKDKLKDQADQIQRAKDEMNLFYVSAALQVPSFISNLIQIKNHLEILKNVWNVMKTEGVLQGLGVLTGGGGAAATTTAGGTAAASTAGGAAGGASLSTVGAAAAMLPAMAPAGVALAAFGVGAAGFGYSKYQQDQQYYAAIRKLKEENKPLPTNNMSQAVQGNSTYNIPHLQVTINQNNKTYKSELEREVDSGNEAAIAFMNKLKEHMP